METTNQQKLYSIMRIDYLSHLNNSISTLCSRNTGQIVNARMIYTRLLIAGTFSRTPFPPKKPRPRGLYGTIPIPSSLYQ